MSANRDDACWRVPVTGSGNRVRLGRDWRRRSIEKQLGEIPRTWSPIVVAADPDEARAKVRVLLGDTEGVIGTPVMKCMPETHYHEMNERRVSDAAA